MTFPAPSKADARLPHLWPCLLLLAAWAGGIWFFSRHNDFPIYYHPDESSKGGQIISGELNFHHPLLLLDASKLLLQATGQPATVENAVRSGRWVSAIFSATAIAALTLLAGRRTGWKGAVLAAVLLPLHPLIYELSHYCKEDPALLLGMSLTFLALDFFLRNPTAIAALLLGAAAGLAVSGKYLGVVMLLLTLPIVGWRAHQERRLALFLGGYLSGFLLLVALINLPYFLQPSALRRGLDYEIHAASLGGNKGLSRDVPHGKYVGIFLDNIGWPLWIGLGLLAARLATRRSRENLGDWLLCLFPLAYTLLLSFSPKTASRYFLAVSPFLIVAGSMGFLWLAEGKGKIRAGLCGTLALAALVVQIQLIRPSVEGLAHDSRREMASWLNENLPTEAALVAESRVHLSKDATWPASRRDDLRLREIPFLPDLGSLAELRQQGIRYLVVIRTSFGGFMDEKRRPAKSLEKQHQRRSAFYHELFAQGRLLKRTGGTGVGILNPEIRVYELPGRPDFKTSLKNPDIKITLPPMVQNMIGNTAAR